MSILGRGTFGTLIKTTLEAVARHAHCNTFNSELNIFLKYNFTARHISAVSRDSHFFGLFQNLASNDKNGINFVGTGFLFTRIATVEAS